MPIARVPLTFDPGTSLVNKLLFSLDNFRLWSHLSCHTLTYCCPPDNKKKADYGPCFPQKRVAFLQHRLDWATEFSLL
jgi:hypothetical protein